MVAESSGAPLSTAPILRARQLTRAQLRACDGCRQRKIRCDGSPRTKTTCTNCSKAVLQCTYRQSLVGRIRVPSKAYIQTLEKRLAKTESLLSTILPGIDLSNIDDVFPSTPGTPAVNATTMAQPTLLTGQHTRVLSEDDNTSDDERSIIPLTRAPPMAPLLQVFWGKSSVIGLIGKTLDAKMGTRPGPDYDCEVQMVHTRWQRPKFWSIPKHEPKDDPPPSSFNAHLPPPDLLHLLVDAYFDQVNIHLPLLHKGLFNVQLAAGLHELDAQFLAVVLLVCALGSRCILDARVLAQPGELKSAGWDFYDMAEPIIRIRFRMSPKLFGLQSRVLALFFLWGSSIPSAGWMMLGLTIGMVLEAGAHRKKVYSAELNLVDELWKRVFWCIFCVDRSMSSSYGRPCTIHDESFDVDLPLEVDDECWDLTDPTGFYPLKHPQSPGKTSYMTVFTCFLKLFHILGSAGRTLYSINHAKTLPPEVRQQWEMFMLSQLDGAMSRWAATTVPAHLRADAPRDSQNVTWNRLRISLWMAFEHLRIFVHIQYIQLAKPATGSTSNPPPSQAKYTSASIGSALSQGDREGNNTSATTETPQSSNLSTNSPLTRCVSSARAIIKLAEEFYAITPAPYGALLSLQAGGLFMSCIVLLLATWSEDPIVATQESRTAGDEREAPAARSGKEGGHRQTQRAQELMEAVVQCLDLIKRAEEYWQPAGKAWDILNELAFSGKPRSKAGEPGVAQGESSTASEGDHDRKATPQYRLLRSLFPHHTYEYRHSPSFSLDAGTATTHTTHSTTQTGRYTMASCDIAPAPPPSLEESIVAGANTIDHGLSGFWDDAWLTQRLVPGSSQLFTGPFDATTSLLSNSDSSFMATPDPFPWMGINLYESQSGVGNSAASSTEPAECGMM